MAVYPVFLNNLPEQTTLVIGGNHEAERKVGELLEIGAQITLITPHPNEELQKYIREGRIDWRDRWYREGDLEDAFMVIVSEQNPEATRPIWEEARRENVLFNAMDDIPHCNFFNGSVVRRGPLTIAISTNGAAPTLSVRMRQKLEDEYGPEYAQFLHLMQALREPMAQHFPDFDTRRELWYELVDSPLLELIEDERFSVAHSLLVDIVGEKIADQVKDTLPNASNRKTESSNAAPNGWLNWIAQQFEKRLQPSET